MGGSLRQLYNFTRSSLIKSQTTCLPQPIKGYRQASSINGVGGRARSTAEEFQRVAEEKEQIMKREVEEKAEQGVGSQTSEKAFDASEEAAAGESEVESVKRKCKEPLGKGDDFHKTG